MMKEIEDAKVKGKNDEDESKNKPYWNDNCMKKMVLQDNREEYSKNEKKERPPNEKLVC